MSVARISIRKVEPHAWRDPIQKVLEDNLPEAATAGRFDWAYEENPHGAAHVWIAVAGEEEVVGTSAAFPREFELQGQTVSALVLSDFAIDPRYRSLGPALQLMRATLAELQHGGYAFALDYPSESMRVVNRRLGGIELGRQVRYARPLGVSGSIRKRWGSGLPARCAARVGDALVRVFDRRPVVPNWISINIGESKFGREFAELAEHVLECHGLRGKRDSEYLVWRFRGGLRFDYTTIALRSSDRLLAYAVVRHGRSKEGTVVEFVCPPDDRIPEYLLTAVIEWARSSDYDSLQASALCDGPWASVLDSLGFVSRETTPGPMAFFSEDSKLSQSGIDVEKCWLTDGDRDG